MRFDSFYSHRGTSVYIDKWHVEEYALHMHSDIEFQLILQGSEECHAGHNIYTLHEGDVLLMNRRQPHSLEHPSPDCVAIWMSINPAFCNSYAAELQNTRFLEVYYPKGHRLNSELYASIIEIYNTCHSNYSNPNYLFKIHELLNHILYLLLSNSEHSILSEAEVKLEQRNEQRIASIIDYVEHNYALHPSLDQLAESLELAPDYLSHFIKDALGITFRDYLNYVRIRHALELIQNKHISQTDILIQTGFSDYRYFISAFEKIYHCKPEEYRFEQHESHDIHKRIFNNQ